MLGNVSIGVLNTGVGTAATASAWQASMEFGSRASGKDPIAAAVSSQVVMISKSIPVIMTVVLVQINVTTRLSSAGCV